MDTSSIKVIFICRKYSPSFGLCSFTCLTLSTRVNYVNFEWLSSIDAYEAMILIGAY